MRSQVILLFLSCWAFLAAQAHAVTLPYRFEEGLALDTGARYGRSEFPVDLVAEEIAQGTWTLPAEGREWTNAHGEQRVWRKVHANKEGWFEAQQGARDYVCFTVESDADRPAILQAAGHDMVYVNGAPRVGDVYANESDELPVQLVRGANWFLFHTGRGKFKARLIDAKARVVFNNHDMTLPDFRVGERESSLGAVILLNASAGRVDGVELIVHQADGSKTVVPLPEIPAFGIHKTPFPIRTPGKLKNVASFPLKLELRDKSHAAILDETVASVRLLGPEQPFKVTFRSAIDGSVQYYAVNPMQSSAHPDGKPALFLSLHGASVEAFGQAQAYSSKSWGYIAAPTNRRPYGFDWEDWGREDAMEVLGLAEERFQTDPHKTYLTGHSMGGHGTWHVGVTFPDRFAAIAPSAGWISFWSYAGKTRGNTNSHLQSIISRADLTGDTLVLRSNYLHHGVYILHGDADDNVPPTEARKMRDELSKFHHDIGYYEQHGAGHWWDASDEPGADCVDWQPIFDFFARHRVPADNEIRTINFSTANPAVSSRSHWVMIDLQERPLEKSAVDMRFDPGTHRFVGTTENVARLRLDLSELSAARPFTIQLDGQSLTNLAVPREKCFWLARRDGRWTVGPASALTMKGAHRSGPFKLAFDHQVVLVYGTGGSPEENKWAREKARFDSECFWYRGNASLDIIPDTEWNAARYKDRGVILYGNADGNKAWSQLLAHSPITVRNGGITAGQKQISGDAISALFLRPREDSSVACVGVVAGTGLTGMRQCDRIPYLQPGIAYPDWTIFDGGVYKSGVSAVLGAGYFGEDWGLDNGDLAWHE